MQSTGFSGLNPDVIVSELTKWPLLRRGGSRAVRLRQASVQLAGCLALYPPVFDPWPLTLSSYFFFFCPLGCLAKGQTSRFREWWMSVNTCTEICSRYFEYTVTNKVLTPDILCSLKCFLKINLKLVGKEKKCREKETTGFEYFCQQLYSVGGRSLLEDNFQALLKNLILCQITSFLFGQLTPDSL